MSITTRPAASSSQSVLRGDNNTGGWYVAQGATNISSIGVQGSVNLILAHGATVSVSDGIRVQEGGSLTIWGQDKDPAKSGTLTVQSGMCIAFGAHSGDIVINGGVINANGGGAAIGGNTDCSGTVTINGGVVNANGNGSTSIGAGGAAAKIAVVINGGVVTAFGDEVSAALGRGPNGGDATVTITGGSVKAIGYVSPEPVGANGEEAYLLRIPNPNGEIVTVNGKVWDVNNHAAAGTGDTDLYLYLSAPDVYVTDR